MASGGHSHIVEVQDYTHSVSYTHLDVYKRQVVLQPESWYAVQDCTVYPLEDADLVRLLDNAAVTLEVFNACLLSTSRCV